jgi:hypothetical protein
MSFQGQEQARSGFRDVGGETTTGSVWAMGFITFAGVLMMVTGTIWFFQGLAAVLDDDFYTIAAEYAFDLDVSTWGWIHMIGGIILGIAGIFLFTGNLAARLLAIFVASVSIILNFLYVPYYPVWSLLIIAMNIGVIWALIAHGHDWVEE